jgi:hypothetical protein
MPPFSSKSGLRVVSPIVPLAALTIKGETRSKAKMMIAM